MLKVIFLNEGGELDSRSGLDPAEALQALKDMLDEISSLQDGDKFIVIACATGES